MRFPLSRFRVESVVSESAINPINIHKFMKFPTKKSKSLQGENVSPVVSLTPTGCDFAVVSSNDKSISCHGQNVSKNIGKHPKWMVYNGSPY